MPKLSPITILDRTLSGLRAQRQEHLDAIAEIDAVFEKFGVSTGAPRGTGRSAVKKAKGGRKARGHFDQPAESFVLGLLDGKSLTTAQINAKWKEVGRGGKADNTLTKLTAAKKVKRKKVKDGRGSQYSVA